jgi:hypothetical protein
MKRNYRGSLTGSFLLANVSLALLLIVVPLHAKKEAIAGAGRRLDSD